MLPPSIHQQHVAAAAASFCAFCAFLRASLSHFAHLFWPGNQVASLPVATAAASAAAAAAAAADQRYKNVGAAERSTKQATPSSLAARTREWSWSRRLFFVALFFSVSGKRRYTSFTAHRSKL